MAENNKSQSLIVGEVQEAYRDLVGHVGAFNPIAYVNQQSAKSLAYARDLQAKNARLKAAAAKAPAKIRKRLGPLVKATSAMSAMQRAMLSADARTATERMNQATHVIPICFDGVATVTLSAVATISAPHNRPWRFLGITTNDGQTSAAAPFRLVSLLLANTEHVVTSNVAFSASAPTSPGVDLGIFSVKNQLGAAQSAYRWRPWGLGAAGVLRSDAQIKIQVYNPAAATASCNISVFVQSSPCGDDDFYTTDAGGVLAANDKRAVQFMSQLRSGAMSNFRR